jgi:small conductance mechanosensitive channel
MKTEKVEHVTSWISGYWDMFMMFAFSLAGAIIVFAIGLWVINLVTRAASKAMLRRHLDVSLQTFLSSLVGVSLKVILLITVAGMLGLQTTSFVTIIGAAGLAVGLALQGSLANFAGGVLILVFKPFKVGDSIEAQGQSGKVIEIQIFNTVLLTAENKTVILPNGILSNHPIVNVTTHGNLRGEISITVAPETDIPRLRQLCLGLMAVNPEVLEDPAPSVTIMKINDASVSLAVRCFAKPGDQPNVVNTLYEEISKLLFSEQIAGQSTPKIIVSNN